MIIERLEVTGGEGTVIRFGSIVAWADRAASPALISFLAQSARNLGPSPRGGRQMGDHIAQVLQTRDPEPHVGFVVVGPSDHGWATLLHGPVQAWDGARWLIPSPNPGWLQAIVTPRPTITVGAAGMPAPAVEPDSLLDLQVGMVPGSGFVLVPGPRIQRANAGATQARGVGTGTAMGAETATPAAAEALAAPGATTVLPANPAPEDEGVLTPTEESFLASDGSFEEPLVGESGGVVEAAEEFPESGRPEPEPPRRRRPVAPGPAGSLDLRAVTVVPLPPVPAASAVYPHPVGAAVVRGIRCPRGHFNKPGTSSCASCRMPIVDGKSDHASGARPTLGILVADDGTIVRVDQGYLVGSDPVRDPTVGGGVARPLVLRGSDVSRTHAEIRLHDWDLIVVDRASTAGTSVFEPGAAQWERLSPYDPRIVPPGSHIAFGQRVVTFISPWTA